MPWFSSDSGKTDYLPARSSILLRGMVVDGWLHDNVASCRIKKQVAIRLSWEMGVKRNLMADVKGLLLPLVVAGAETNDIKLVEDTLYKEVAGAQVAYVYGKSL